MGSSAWDTLWDRFFTAAVAMAYLGTPAAHFGALALERLGPDLLTVVAMLGSVASFEHPRVPQLATGVEEALA